MREQEKKDFVASIRKELIEEERLYLGEEFAVDSAEFMVEALEKQIPKKPIKYGVTDSNGTFHPINGIDGVPYDLCPSCETNLCTTGMFGIKNRTKYCQNCGQRLDWSEEG